MTERQQDEKPEVYALRKESGRWQISRRDFLKAASAGAAAAGVLLRSGVVRAEETLEEVCKDAPAHKNWIACMKASPDGRYLATWDGISTLKLWNFESHELMGKKELANSAAARSWLAFLSFKGEMLLAASGNSDTQLITPTSSLDVKYNGTYWGNAEAAAGTDSDFYWGKSIFYNGMNYSVEHVVMKSNAPYSFTDETLIQLDSEPKHLALVDGSRKLLVCGTSSAAVYDLDTQEQVLTLDIVEHILDIAVLPGGTKALSCLESAASSEYRLDSLVDGANLWTLPADSIHSDKAGAEITAVKHVAVLPDGMTAVLSGNAPYLYWISLEDGSLLRTIPAPAENALIAVKYDGTQIAAAGENKLWFYRLPDWEVCGCPVDLDEMKDDVKGITVEKADPVSGQTITYTLPCGAEIPAGAVCTCNCVSGTIPSCSCVGHVSCSCDSHVSCSCQGHTTYSGSHYWHPN